MLTALDLATGRMVYRIRERKRRREFLDCSRSADASTPASGCT
jgi:hypothetical protein